MTVLTDMIRNNQELSDAIYTLIARLAAYHLAERGGRILFGPGMTESERRDLCRIAAMILPHLPEAKPAPDAPRNDAPGSHSPIPRPSSSR